MTAEDAADADAEILPPAIFFLELVALYARVALPVGGGATAFIRTCMGPKLDACDTLADEPNGPPADLEGTPVI